MKKYFILLKLLLAISPVICFAQPKLLSLSPGKVYTQNVITTPNIDIENTDHNTQAYIPTIIPLKMKVENLGSNITETNVRDRVKVFFTKSDKFQQVKISSWDQGSINTEIFSTEWLTNDWPVAVYLEVDGIRTNTIYLVIVDPVQVAPTILRINSGRLIVAKEPILIRLVGKNMGQNVGTNIKVNGIQCNLANYDFFEGWADVYLPQKVSETPGTYYLVLESIYGKSSPFKIEIEKPLMKLAPVVLAPQVKTSEQQEKQVNKMQPVEAKGYEITGITVNLSGTIASESNRSILINYISELDQVKRTSNNILVDGIQNVTIKMYGNKVPRITLEHVKLSIERKLKSLGIPGTVVTN